MGFASLDDLISEMTGAGKIFRADWNKLTHATTAQVAGEWYALAHALGNPTAAGLVSGTNLSFQACTDQTTGSILHNGIVTPDTKHIINASAFSAAATTMPAIFMLVDLLGFYPMTTVTATGNQATINSSAFTVAADILTHASMDIASISRVRLTTTGSLPTPLATVTDYYTVRQSATTSKLSTTLANAIAGVFVTGISGGSGTQTITVPLPRYTDGKGVQCFVTPTTVMGAATPNMLINYTNTTPTAGKTTPTTLPIGKTAAPIGLVTYSGTGTGKYGPFMPLAAGDAGILSVEQLNLSASYLSGALAWCLCKPLLTLPMTTVGIATERDLLNQVPSLPRIYDGACLTWLMYAGAATPVSSPFYGHLDFIWG